MNPEEKIKERLTNRLELCQKELRRAKNAISFWSEEMRVVGEALAKDKQFDFSEYFNKQEK